MAGESKMGHVLIKRETLCGLIRKSYQLSSMVLVLEYVCTLRKVEATLTAAELCEILNISKDQLEKAHKKNWIRCGAINNLQIFRAFDISILAEKINRRKVQKIINQLPTNEH